MPSQFQIVFRGELLDGFDLTAVKASAGRRLKAAPEQIDRIFSGKRAILKKGLTDEIAQRYLKELQRIGMHVAIEVESIKATTPLPADAEPVDPIGAIDPVFSSTPVRSEPQRVTSRDEPAFDPLKTQLSAMSVEDSPPPPERWSQPTIAVSQRHLSSPGDDGSSEPTLIVPPRNSAASEPTIVVTRGSSSSATGSPAKIVSSSFAPTMIVPQRNADEASEPTMIVPPRSSAASEPTMIVPPRHSAASEPTLIVPPRTSAGAQPTVIVRSNHQLPPADKAAEESFDAEKTLLSASESIADYFSPPSDEQLAKAVPTPAPAASPSSAVDGEVQCPTCGDKQPKRVYCRRCGHALQLPPKQPAMGDSTITKRPFSRPVLIPPAVAPEAPPPQAEETLLVDDIAVAETKNAAGKGFLAAPTWLIIGLLFVMLLAVAAWLIFS